ncbi:hypothetical protein [Legionella genomosp. 1]|uniref:hypothetical protein n=1 Tax=Legionella genomosp. 1 TaxID=1093625 RepID=UPI001055B69B|nr:hypothetical protein [Legionella genomosp. 1]
MKVYQTILCLMLTVNLMLFSLNNYAYSENCSRGCKDCCYSEYQFCTHLPDAAYAMAFNSTKEPEGIKNFLENKLSNSTFLGVKIIDKPNIDISKIDGIYYLAINDQNGVIIRNKLPLRYVCSKISFHCRSKCLS